MTGAPLATAFVRLRVDPSAVRGGAASAGRSAGASFAGEFNATSTAGIARDSRGRLVTGTSAAAAASGRRAGSVFGRSFSTGMGSSLRRFAGPIVSTFGVYAVGRLIKNSVELEAAYSTTMRQIAVATNAPKAALGDLDELAQRLGADTVFSTNDAANAMLQLAKGGLKPAQIEAGVLSDTLTLAAAGGLDLATSANTVVKGMGAFKLSARDASEVTTALAGAANRSSADVSGLTQALSQAGGVAHSSGLTIEETTGILGLFADNAIQGSDAGTSLRTMLLRLTPTSKTAQAAMNALHLSFVDSNGSFVDAEAIARRLQKAFGDLTQQQRNQYLTTIFGQDAIRGANALIDSGAKGLRGYIAASKDQTNAEKLAQAGMSGTRGALEQLSGSFQNAELQVGRGLAPAVQGLSADLTDFLNTHDVEAWVHGFVDGLVDLGHELQPLASDLLDLGRDALPTLVDGAGTLLHAVEPLIPILDKAVGLFESLPGPVRDLAFAMAAVKFSGLASGLDAAALSGGRFIDVMKNSAARTAIFSGVARQAGTVAGLGLLIASFQQGTDEASTFIETVGAGAAIGFGIGGPQGAAIGGAVGILGYFARALTDSGDAAAEAAPPIGDYADTLNQLTGAATRATRALVAQTLQQDDLLTSAKNLGINTADVVSAVLGQGAASARVTAQLRQARQGEDAYRDSLLAQGKGTAEVNALTAQYHQQVKDLAQAIGANRAQLRGQSHDQLLVAEAVRGSSVDVKGLNELLGKIPKDARTQIEALGVDSTRADVRDITSQYDNIDGKTVQTLLRLLGYDTVKSQLASLKATLATIHDKNVTISTTFTRSIGPSQSGPGVAVTPAAGGYITGPGTSTSDSIPARLSNGEFVLRSAAVEKYGVGLLQQMNAMRFAWGGPVGGGDDVFHIGGLPQLVQQSGQLSDLLRAFRAEGVKSDRRDSLLGRIHDSADKMRSEVRDRLSSARDDLRGLLQSQRQLEQSITQSFTTASTYGEGAPSTARDLFVRAHAQVNDARLFQHVLRQLKSKGANPALLRALATAGPGAIVQAQAFAGMSRRELNRYEHLIGAGNRAAAGIGDFIGRDTFGPRIHDARQEFHEMRRAYQQLDHRLDQLPKKVGDATAKALDGTSVKMDGRKVGELVGRHHDRIDRGG